MPIGVSRTSTVPQARPLAGQRSTAAGRASHRSSRETSVCHWSLPRSLSTIASRLAAPATVGDRWSGSRARPPVRSERVGVSTSADEMSICPVAGFHRPAAVTTARGSLICRPLTCTVSFSTSPPARVICQLSPSAARAADALTKPPSSMPRSAVAGNNPSHRDCQRVRSPESEQSAAIACDPGAARSHGSSRGMLPATSGQRLTRAPPVSVTSNPSSAAVTAACP